MIREAVASDVGAIAAIAQRRREQYEVAQPVFWRVADNATEIHSGFLTHLVEDEDVVSLVAVDGDEVVGYIFATLGPAPPVYDPGGPTASIDDFTVAWDELWSSVGIDLCLEARRRVQQRGAVQLVVVCGRHDHAKRAALDHLGLSVASEWYVGPL